MSNYIWKPEDKRIANITSLNTVDCKEHCPSQRALKAVERFMQTASLLPDNGFLGWQMTADREGKVHAFAFSSEDVRIMLKDFGCIFQNCADAAAIETESFEKLHEDFRKVYVLRYMPGISDEIQSFGNRHISFGDEDTICFEDVVKAMKESGAVIRVMAGTGHDSRGVITISLAEELTLKMRMLLSLAFSDTVAVEVETAPNADFGLPAKYLMDSMMRLLEVFMLENSAKKGGELSPCGYSFDDIDDFEADDYDDTLPDDGYSDDDDPEADGDRKLDDLLLDELELSVHSCNCLWREGINTVGEFRKMSLGDFTKIRKLGRKSLEEIIQKLVLMERTLQGELENSAKKEDEASPCGYSFDNIDDFEADDYDDTLPNDGYSDDDDPEADGKNSGEGESGDKCVKDADGGRKPDDLLLDELELSVRSCNCLRREGINTVGELRKMSLGDFAKIRKLGWKNQEEIIRNLRKLVLMERTLQGEQESPGCSARLTELIGLKDVKEQVRRIEAFARMKKDMETQGRASVPVTLNMEFVGNPGTAKTTVARILAGIFEEIGILSSSQIVETGRADLVAGYVGQTAINVKSVFQRARGKLLFIDEAYSLASDSTSDFGYEAINTIVQEMENNRDDTIVVFAGYPEEMEFFFSRNPGLRSRVPFRISFTDYSADEMVQIAGLEAQKRGFSICPQAMEKVASLCKEAKQHSDMGNGRFSRNLVENAILSYALRVYGEGTEDMEGVEKDFTLVDEDFVLPDNMQAIPETEEAKKPVPIGFRC